MYVHTFYQSYTCKHTCTKILSKIHLYVFNHQTLANRHCHTHTHTQTDTYTHTHTHTNKHIHTHTQTDTYTHTHTHTHTHTYTHIYDFNSSTFANRHSQINPNILNWNRRNEKEGKQKAHTGWRRLIGSPKLQIICHKRATKYRSLLRKMTYKEKGSYESSPPCNKGQYQYGVALISK